MRLGRNVLILALIALVLLVAPIYAQEAEEVPDAASQEAEAKRQKAEKRAASKKRKRVMESCLTLVRSYYTAENDAVSAFV